MTFDDMKIIKKEESGRTEITQQKDTGLSERDRQIQSVLNLTLLSAEVRLRLIEQIFSGH